MPRPIPGGIRTAVLAILLIVVPLLLAWFGRQVLRLDVEDRRRVEAETRLTDALKRMAAARDPLEYFTRYFRRIENRVFTAADPLVTWARIAPFLKRRFPGMLDLVFLDDSGKPVPAFTDRPVPVTLAKKYVEAYRRFLSAREPLPDTAQAFAKNFLGPWISVDREHHGTFHYASPIPNPLAIYVSRPYSQGLFIVFFRMDRFFSPKRVRGPLPELAMKLQVARFNHTANRTAGGVRLCLATRRQKARLVFDELDLMKIYRPGLWKTLQHSKGRLKWFGDTVLAQVNLFPHLWVVGRADLAPEAHISGDAMVRAALVLIALLGVLALARKAEVFSAPWVRSVRLKLLAAFLYAVLMPLIIMGMTARTFLTDHQLVLEQETYQKAEKAIQTFDARFERHWKSLVDSLRYHFMASDFNASDSFRDFQDRFDQYLGRYAFDICYLYDQTGKKIFGYYAPDLPTLFGGYHQLLPKITKTIFSSYRPAPTIVPTGVPSGVPTGAPAHASPSAPIETGVREDPLLASLNRSLRVFGKLEYHIRQVDLFTCIFPLGNDRQQLSHLAFFQWNLKTFAWKYLVRQLAGYTRDLRLGDFLAWCPETPTMSFPSPFRFSRLAYPHKPQVVSKSSGYRAKVTHRGQNYLVTGLCGTVLKDFSFLVVTSDREIRAEIADLTWKFMFATLTILGICLIVVFMLARLFLGPLGNLLRGMDAFSRRDFDSNIPVTSGDELGLLALSFNDTLEDMKDLEVARTVQESLFPSQPLRLGSWDIFGSCLPASQVGGDYFDYFALDEDRVIFIIGDVSGHGVGAALVVAMAKAIIGHPATTGKPLEILASLNSIILRILRRKKMMSCCLGLLDRRTNTLTMANAGQTYPILIGEGPPRFLELKGYPLGSISKWQAAGQTYGPLRKAILVLYTDGLIEALDHRGTPIGYDRFLAELPGLVKGTAVETEKAVRAWHEKLVRPGPPDDDISLIVVQEILTEGGTT